VTIDDVLLGGRNPGQFRTTRETCTDGPLQPGATCQAVVVFAPTLRGDKAATLVVESDAPGSPHAADVAGRAIGPEVVIEPGAHDFGEVLRGQRSDPFTFKVTNTGDAVAHLGEVSLAGADRAQFEKPAALDLCSAKDLPTGGSCTVGTVFAPTAAGDRRATLVVSSRAPDAQTSAALSGRGTSPPVLVIEPPEHDFGDQPVGTPSDPFRFTVKNISDGPVVIDDIGLEGPNPGQFQVADDDCPVADPLPAGGRCHAAVVFAPASLGAKEAALVVQPASGPLATAKLLGTGTAWWALECPEPDFGDVPVGRSAEHACTILNMSDAPLPVTRVAIVGGDESEFDTVDERCAGTSIAPDDECVVDVAFRPTSAGEKRDRLEVTAEAPGSPQGEALTGRGIRSATIVVDDLDSRRARRFTRGGPGWREADAGLRGHTFWNYASRSAKAWGVWRAVLPQPGVYQVLVYIPEAKAGITDARYQVFLPGGAVRRPPAVDQVANAGRWVSLGEFRLTTVGKVRLSDRTSGPVRPRRPVAFDAVKFVLVSTAP
jgi:hypothetical protein